jgi:hypothetical protein
MSTVELLATAALMSSQSVTGDRELKPANDFAISPCCHSPTCRPTVKAPFGTGEWTGATWTKDRGERPLLATFRIRKEIGEIADREMPRLAGQSSSERT